MGKAAVIRVSSAIFPSFSGTLKSTRTNTRFPDTSKLKVSHNCLKFLITFRPDKMDKKLKLNNPGKQLTIRPIPIKPHCDQFVACE